eukprot:TRINITY_DN2317_c0_g2_i3.p1 TRINITY_DN2317_c0_g2~~TRINITY_DN2317_c0_g2_i3.p1  ORF type:complete len:296 (-),score=91.32 TRINITY_DN2317_c0_g2_i3:83-970(-)
MSLVFGTTSLLTLWLLRPAFLFGVARSIFEAVTLRNFQIALLNILGEDPETVQKLVLEQPAGKLLSVPPCCCCFRSCETEKHLTPSLMDWCLLGTRQFVLVVPFVAFINLWVEIDGNNYTRAATILKAISTISMFFALYALFIIYQGTKEILHKFESTNKFVAIKLILIISAIQEFIIEVAISDDDSIGSMYDAPAKRAYIMNFVLVFESFILAVLLRRAFPASEIEIVFKEHRERLRATLLGQEYVATHPNAQPNPATIGFSAAHASVAQPPAAVPLKERNAEAKPEDDGEENV